MAKPPLRNIQIEPTADKRSVVTDALEVLGTILDDRAHRDAIHLAVEPVIAGQTLKAGDDIGFIAKGVVGTVDHPIGIVDPFLPKGTPIAVGDRVFLVIYPRKITSLRHVWTHPDVEEEAQSALPSFDRRRADSEAFIRQWIDAEINAEGWEVEEYGRMTYEKLMAAADEGDYLSQGGLLEGKQLHPDFWMHYEIVRGRSATQRQKDGLYFSCAC